MTWVDAPSRATQWTLVQPDSQPPSCLLRTRSVISAPLSPRKWIILYTAVTAPGAVLTHEPQVVTMTVCRCIRPAMLFVCSRKWHDDRGGNRKHNRLPDRLIPRAWPETGTEPVSNQRKITRRGYFVCSAYILKIINIVNFCDSVPVWKIQLIRLLVLWAMFLWEYGL